MHWYWLFCELWAIVWSSHWFSQLSIIWRSLSLENFVTLPWWNKQLGIHIEMTTKIWTKDWWFLRIDRSVFVCLTILCQSYLLADVAKNVIFFKMALLQRTSETEWILKLKLKKFEINLAFLSSTYLPHYWLELYPGDWHSNAILNDYLQPTNCKEHFYRG